ncbi:MAG: DUF349 domain-containing protein [Erysipelotrichales bacterium]|nr:DUF349 domain-containing protein [Erysipelotrichales bacterium]
MTNEYNELVVERDMEDDIQDRKNLIEQAKKLLESDDKNVYTELGKLQKKWRKIENYDSALDAQLTEEFEAIADAIYAKRKEVYATNEEAKKSLIARAEALSAPADWNAANKEMEGLMNEWRTTGSAGKDTDDILWEKFNELRQSFFANRRQYFEELSAKYENARNVKAEIIEKAKALADSTEWNKTGNLFNELLEEWKEIGSAGKEFENKLWNEFNEIRQGFYARRNEYYEALHAKQQAHAEDKKGLIAKANEILTSKNFSRANTAAMKGLSDEWKKVGSSGKEEDALWKEFRGVMDAYFEGLRENNERRQAEYRQKLQDSRAYKQEQINNLKRQIKRMQEEIATMYSQREIDNTEAMIEDKKEYIAELEEDIADIEKKLAQ